ncbi:MAG: MBL fold metallo-hydrolase [Deltaproteobacteria bacterium]|nr:MBL fold metallo-hydrolase [Deltaproteobacteria bacterium]
MGRFDDRATLRRGLGDNIRWRVVHRLLGRGPLPDLSGFRTPIALPDLALLHSTAPSLTWVGHATFALRLGGALVLTDPNWSAHLARLFTRRAPPGIALQELPRIDVVAITHNHMDHLDLPTLSQIGNGPLYVTPLGNGRYLRELGITNIKELDWWQSVRLNELQIALVPARHFSMRTPFDRNDALWGGFVFKSSEGTLYHSGDTAYFQGFRAIRERWGPIDWAALAVGSYEPRWFMESQHMNPEDAAVAFVDLDARALVPMHWGTFSTADEPLGQPPERLRSVFRFRRLDERRLWQLAIGETRALTNGR